MNFQKEYLTSFYIYTSTSYWFYLSISQKRPISIIFRISNLSITPRCRNFRIKFSAVQQSELITFTPPMTFQADVGVQWSSPKTALPYSTTCHVLAVPSALPHRSGSCLGPRGPSLPRPVPSPLSLQQARALGHLSAPIRTEYYTALSLNHSWL